MMPPTWGRTSATRKADVRPGNSVVIGTRSGRTATTLTSGTPPPGGPEPCPDFSHPADVRPTTRTARIIMILRVCLISIEHL